MRRSYQTNGDQGERDEVQDVLESYGPGRGPADVGRSAGGRSERLRWAGTATRSRPNLPGLPQWLPPGPGADRGPGTSGGAGAPGGPSAQGGSATGVPLGGSPALPAGVPLDHPAAVCPPLFGKGLATGDFEPVFRELVGETTALSANTVVRLKEHWGGEYEAWRQRPLVPEHRYAYIWADGVYL